MVIYKYTALQDHATHAFPGYLRNPLLEAMTHPVSVELSNLYVTSKLLRLPIVWKSLSGSLLYVNYSLSLGHECNLLVFLTVT